MIKKIYIIIFIFLLTVSCGVKNDPFYKKKEGKLGESSTQLKVTL